MQIYLVGGAVRDQLLGLEVKDRDWVVVGATPEQMIAAGYRPVGKDFPVFLHPETHEEYALARTERKSGKGYKGFTFHTDPGVKLEQDLIRRDLRINAMAMDEAGNIFDPYDGQADIRNRQLRHVSEAFSEDPLRVLRVARFAARFNSLGFEVAPETKLLMRQLSQTDELLHLSAERVWQELARGLMEEKPSRMFEVLRDCGALQVLLPEVGGAGQEKLLAALRGAEIVVLLLPDTPDTVNVLDAEALGVLEHGAKVINPGRGPLIDDDALLAALDSGQVGGATLDVFRVEPLPAEHPYWAHPNVTVTPHIASETRADTASEVIAENIRRAEAGEPLLFVVDRAAGY
mgnify:CR=1 FL=1